MLATASLKTACSRSGVLKQAFKEDCGLDLQLGKCKLYITGMSLIDARTLVRDIIYERQRHHLRASISDIINDEQRLSAISDLLQLHEDQSKNVIQVQRMTCVGVPIGSPAFITEFVKDQTSAMVDDVRKLRVLSDPLTHTRLVRFCHNTRLSYLNCNCCRL